MNSDLWLGSVESAAGYLQYKEYMANNPRAVFDSQPNPFLPDDDEKENPMQPKFESHLLEAFGNVAVMNISGGLLNDDNWMTRMFELTTYPEIIRASAELMEAEDITDVVLNIDSGGGTVAGLEDAGRALKFLSSVKRTVSATSGKMSSAAYWLGAVAKTISATPMAQVGSIGVTSSHLSYKQHLEDKGIKPTVFRAGEYKAIGNRLEDLDAESKRIIQTEMDSMYGFFLDHIAEERGLDIKAKGTWAEGRVFFGEEAINVGLVDNLNPPEAVIAKLEKRESSTNATQMNGETPMGIEAKRTVLLNSKEDLAAAAAGVPLENLQHRELTPEEQAAAAEAENKQPEPAAEAEDKQPEPAAKAEDKQPDVSAMKMVADMAAENSLLKRDLETAKSELTAVGADTASLLKIVAEASNRMEIGMRQATTNFDGLSASAAISKYASVKEQFNATHKIGRVSKETVEAEQPKVFHMGIVPK